MKTIRYFILVMIVGLLTSCIDNNAEKFTLPKEKQKLVWSDEFNYKGMPDESKWNYEIGFVRNKEQQYYTNRPENISVHSGYLEIKAIKEDYPNKFYKENEGEYIEGKLNIPIAHYTSASINTENKYNVKYGRIEMRAALPEGKGVWPAFWMLGSNRPEVGWPKCGEIDIMEYVGRDKNKTIGSIHFLTDKQEHFFQSVPYTFKDEKTSDFHVYAIEWDEKAIHYFVDGDLYWSVYYSLIDKYFPETSGAFKKPFYMVLNFALGGSFGGPIDNSIFPQSYKIDYVRVYEL